MKMTLLYLTSKSFWHIHPLACISSQGPQQTVQNLAIPLDSLTTEKEAHFQLFTESTLVKKKSELKK